MFMQHVPKGGFVWEDKSVIKLECDIDLRGDANFRYEWKSKYCTQNYRFLIPCNTAVRTFDAFMQRTEMQLDHVKSTRDKVSANQIRKIMDQLIEDFEESRKSRKFFFSYFD